MLEIIIVFGIVAIVAVIAGRSFYRTMTGKSDGCGCAGNCLGCTCKEVADTQKGQDIDKRRLTNR
jgi:hypothetical protein